MPDAAAHIVSDVMTRPVVTVGRDVPLKAIVRAMRERRVSAVPVVDGRGRVLGVVSEADLLAGAEALTAGELMTAPAVTVRPDVTLAQAARLMALRHVKRLPVVDDAERLRGIVSRRDLLKVFLRPDEDIEEEVRRTVVSYLFPTLAHAIHVYVRDGIVTLRGQVHDPSLIWVAERLVRAVEGVVGVESRLSGEEAAQGGHGRPTGPPE
ncbi:CBS domain-containing protein [Streptomyces sp. NK08204]|uniref:CBS domain-containing protein n=1 Tax=Streptomyces sp. NK08204 TaxID=2873260 RepID=UPI001CED0F11|nr:CBS domain-containing protein [Streptomyces sp. NK08204]